MSNNIIVHVYPIWHLEKKIHQCGYTKLMKLWRKLLKCCIFRLENVAESFIRHMTLLIYIIHKLTGLSDLVDDTICTGFVGLPCRLLKLSGGVCLYVIGNRLVDWCLIANFSNISAISWHE